MDDLGEALLGAIDDHKLPDPPPVARLAMRNRRRKQWRALGASLAVVAVAVGLVVALVPSSAPSPSTTRSVAELAAIRAGQAAFDDSGGPPIYAYGVVGSDQLWVLDGDGLFLSTVGPAGFSDITPPNVGGSPAARVLAVRFLTAADGFAVVNASESPALELDRTTNGGATWTSAVLPPVVPGGVSKVTLDMTSPAAGFLDIEGYGSNGALQNFLLATTDGGTSWSIASQHDPVSSVMFVSSSRGWGLSGATGASSLLGTSDGGVTWAHVDLPAPGEISWELPSFFGDQGVIVGRRLGGNSSKPYVATSDDGGSTWTPAPTPPFTGPGCSSDACTGSAPFAAVDQERWLYWSGDELYTTTDAGAAWDRTLPNIAFAASGSAAINVVPGSPYSDTSPPIVFTSSTDGYAVASSGHASLILVTHDGGHHFTAYSSPKQGK